MQEKIVQIRGDTSILSDPRVSSLLYRSISRNFVQNAKAEALICCLGVSVFNMDFHASLMQVACRPHFTKRR